MNDLKQAILELIMHDEYEVIIRNSGKYRFLENYKFETHNHVEFEINYIKSGCCIMGIGDEYVPLKQGDCIVINEWVPHCFMVDIEKRCSITQLEFSVFRSKEYSEKIKCLSDTYQFFKIENCENICTTMELICKYYRVSEEQEYARNQLAFTFALLYSQLTGQMDEIQKEQIKLNHGKIGKVVAFIHDHLDTDIDLEEVSKNCGISSRYVRKYFANQIGMNCSKYITMLRIAKAKELLWNSASSITEIALMTGFNSSQYFSRVFHRYSGMTPICYRNMWKGKRAELKVYKK